MGTITIGANYITGPAAAGHWGHLQILQPGSGSDRFEIEVQSYEFNFRQWIFRQFLFEEVQSVVGSGGAVPEFDSENWSETTVTVPGVSTDSLWDTLGLIHAQFRENDPAYTYGIGQNSNSYVATLLWMVGADLFSAIDNLRTDEITGTYVGDTLPVGLLAAPFFFIFPEAYDPFPGADRNLLTDGYGFGGSIEWDINLELSNEENFIQTGPGDDIIHGMAGDDTIVGNGGNDILSGGQGNDILNGGADFDAVDYSEEAGVVRKIGIVGTIGGLGGSDIAQTVGSENLVEVFSTDGGHDLLIDIELITATDFDDLFHVFDLVSLSQTAIDGAGSDRFGDTISTLSGNAGADIDLVSQTVYADPHGVRSVAVVINEFENAVGSNFDDVLSGDALGNILVGAGGSDELSGGSGNDILIIDGSDTEIFGGEGRDIVFIDDDSGVTFDAEGTGVEVVIGGSGSDVLSAATTQGGPVVYLAGGDSADTLNISINGGETDPVVVWGGLEEDTISISDNREVFGPGGDLPLGILGVSVTNLSEDNFHLFDPSSLGFDLSSIDVLILNPEASDKYQINGYDIIISPQVYSVGLPAEEYTWIDGEETIEYVTYPGVVFKGVNGRDHVDTFDITFMDGVETAVAPAAIPGLLTLDLSLDGDGNPLDGATDDWPAGYTPQNSDMFFEAFRTPDTNLDTHVWTGFYAQGQFYPSGSIFPSVPHPGQLGEWFFAGASISNSGILFTEIPSVSIESSSSFSYSEFLDGLTVPQVGSFAVGGTGDGTVFFGYAGTNSATESAFWNLFGTSASDVIDSNYIDEQGSVVTQQGQVIYGEGGNDSIYDGAGDDIVFGGDGNDFFYAGDGSDILDGGEGTQDVVSYSRSNIGLTIDMLDALNSTGIAAGDTFISIERLHGTAYDDTIVVDAGLRAYGNAGNDILQDSAGTQRLTGGSGADTFRFVAGDGVQDRVSDFQLGIDLIDISAWGVTFFDQLTLTERVNGQGNPTGDVTLEFGSESVRLDGFSDADIASFGATDFIFADGPPATGNGVVKGTSGNDIINVSFMDEDGDMISDNGQLIQGMDGADSIYDGAGDDTVEGGAGRDQLYAGGGSDAYDGGADRDMVVYRASTVGLTIDMLDGSNGTGIAAGDTFASIERLYGTDFGDTIVVGAGVWAFGENGDDVLQDSSGSERMSGGQGADTFVFTLDGTMDRILDFELGTDIIDLSAWGASSVADLTIVERTSGLGTPQGDLLLTFGSETTRIDGYDASYITSFDDSSFVF
ncbi:hypothetical protein ILP92_16275 [Maribius pontilimi]|uniref:Ca2+-binding protein, RTX toxin-related n=1 Tax=Palleronia pontilimi TaxID=1964209 RepID=A0A934IJ61_9RHOB|nr:hypothetical protein [Palleronia pontilimi]MBJ3764305.1 hypothetical protein [Palleronia pontilimi]